LSSMCVPLKIAIATHCVLARRLTGTLDGELELDSDYDRGARLLLTVRQEKQTDGESSASAPSERARGEPGGVAIAQPAETGNQQVDWTEVAGLLWEIRTQLAKDDIRAVDAVERLMALPVGTPHAEQLGELAKLVKWYDFESALSTLDKLAGILGIDP